MWDTFVLCSDELDCSASHAKVAGTWGGGKTIVGAQLGPGVLSYSAKRRFCSLEYQPQQTFSRSQLRERWLWYTSCEHILIIPIIQQYLSCPKINIMYSATSINTYRSNVIVVCFPLFYVNHLYSLLSGHVLMLFHRIQYARGQEGGRVDPLRRDRPCQARCCAEPRSAV